MKGYKYYRIRLRKPNGRTEILPIRFATEEEAQDFIDYMNEQQNGNTYEMASPKYW